MLDAIAIALSFIGLGHLSRLLAILEAAEDRGALVELVIHG